MHSTDYNRCNQTRGHNTGNETLDSHGYQRWVSNAPLLSVEWPTLTSWRCIHKVSGSCRQHVLTSSSSSVQMIVVHCEALHTACVIQPGHFSIMASKEHFCISWIERSRWPPSVVLSWRFNIWMLQSCSRGKIQHNQLLLSHSGKCLKSSLFFWDWDPQDRSHIARCVYEW